MTRVGEALRSERTAHEVSDSSVRQQVVEVDVDRGYRPATILARSNLPIRLVFRRADDDPCTERVIFSEPRLERRLIPEGVTIVDLPAHGTGEVRFTCGMGRYRGVIRLEPEPASGRARFLRRARQAVREPRVIATTWMLVATAMLVVALAGITTTEIVLALAAVLLLVSTASAWSVIGSKRTSETSIPE
jgi:hypothetical protein